MNAPVDTNPSATARTDAEHALRVALQALEARWPRRFDADCQRDTAAIKVVNAALDAIDASKRMAKASPTEAEQVMTTNVAEVIVRPDTATREVTLSIHTKAEGTPPALAKVSLALTADAACKLGAMLLASGEVMAEAAPSDGGAQ